MSDNTLKAIVGPDTLYVPNPAPQFLTHKKKDWKLVGVQDGFAYYLEADY